MISLDNTECYNNRDDNDNDDDDDDNDGENLVAHSRYRKLVVQPTVD